MMKTLLLFLLAVTIGSLYSCKGNNDDDPAPNNSQYYTDSTEFAGRLQVHVTRWNGVSQSNIGNAYVSIHLTFADADAELRDVYGAYPLSWAYTGSDGFVDFGWLNRDNYYILTRVVMPNQQLSQRIDVVQVQSGRIYPIVKDVVHEF